jgi:hypothetical protein
MGKMALPAALTWLAAVAWVFAGPLFAGRVLFFRDVSVTYFPDFVFVAGALREGVWPLWHPAADGGAPFLMAYPVHLLLLLAAGPKVTLALSPALHVLLAMAGTGVLARRLGVGPAGAALSGAVFGLSGFMIGSVLYPIFLAAAWAPLAIALFLALVEAPTPRRVAALAVALAVQVSTLGAAAVVQTGLAALVLVPARPSRRAVLASLGAMVLAAVLAAPVLLGSVALLEGTARGQGFEAGVGLSYSAPPGVLMEAVLPRFLGDPHTFSDVGFWGQPLFPGGTPFFLSLYLGPLVLLLAARNGGRDPRLWILVALGVLLSLGAHGPLAPVLEALLQTMRGPVKFFLLTTLGLALLAGRGLDRAERGSPPGRGLLLVPGLLVLALALWAWMVPSAVAAGWAVLVPEAASPRALDVIARQWPHELAVTGALTVGLGLALLLGGGRRVALAGLLVVLDLLRVNGGLSPSAEARFYDLLPQVGALVEEARPEGRFRWFSYGVAHSLPLTWDPAVARQGSDVWLFYLDRQSLLARAHVLEGLEGVFDVDRMGLAPEGSTLAVAETRPERYPEIHERLREANVRWVLAFHPLPEDLVRLRGQAGLPGVREVLRLYEVRRPLPRAFWTRRTTEAGAEPEPEVGYERLDPHTVRLTASTPPGFIVVLDGYHPDWEAEDRSGPVRVQRALGRYQALPTPGGERVVTLRYRPAWLPVALALAALGGVALALLVRREAPVSPLTSAGTARAILSRRVRKATENRTDGTRTELDSV